MSSRSRRRRGNIIRKTEINMIPFLDILLTLLIVFMIATPAVNRSIDVNLPASSIAKVTEDVQQKDIVVVEVHTDYTYTLFFNTEKYTSLTQGQLQSQLNRVFSSIKDKKNLVVQLAADKSASYAYVINALDIFKAYGIVDVGLITKGSDDSK